MLLIVSGSAAFAVAPSLGTAQSYSILAGSIVSNTGPTTMPGNLGISPSIGVPPHYTGFPPGIVGPPGTIHDADANAGLAQAANTAAFGDLDQVCTVTYAGTEDLVGHNLVAGVYCADAFTLSGTLTLSGSGVWIFKSSSTLITSGTANVVGGDPCNVWWRVVSSATLGTNTQLIGNILALTSISLQTGATLNGRALAQTGAVTMDSNVITLPKCSDSVPNSNSSTTIGVGTGVTVPNSGGQIPVIKAKWEQDYSGLLEDGDPSHITPGSQFLPTCEYQKYEPIKYCTVVTDEENNGDVQQAWVDVYHPKDSWDNGSFKYEVPLVKVENKQESINLVTAAYNAGLITFNEGYDLTDVLFELNKSTAKVWCGDGELYYEQPAGTYTVSAGALDWNANPSNSLNNTFYYIPTTCFAVDNTAVNYGSVQVSHMKVIAGDTIFSQGDGMMTVRNLGNTYMQVTVVQDDMGFGKDFNGMWNVEFDGRAGHAVESIIYQPYGAQLGGTPALPVMTTLPGLIPHSTDEELDFSIHLKKAIRTGVYGGTMTLASVIVDWCDVPGADCESNLDK